jgi:hypothetical protein
MLDVELVYILRASTWPGFVAVVKIDEKLPYNLLLSLYALTLY